MKINNFAHTGRAGYVALRNLKAIEKNVSKLVAMLDLHDSGGLQKGVFFCQRNCFTLRDQTEWVELVENGCNIITGAVKERIIKTYSTMRDKPSEFNKEFYGNGIAS